MTRGRRELHQSIFHRLYTVFGPQHWWPAETPFEVIVGAILTQNTAWRNVETTIKGLREHGLLSFEALCQVPVEELAPIIRSSGYYNQKARKLKAFCDHIRDGGTKDLAAFLTQDAASLRRELLAIPGIGFETADSIVLYAAHQPSFVVDTYTHRIFSRHNWVMEDISYEELRDYFMECLEPDVDFFKEYHALLVRTGHRFCRRKPLCEECPLYQWS